MPEGLMYDAGTIELFRLQADICKTLADPNRLMILHLLREGERSVSQIVSSLSLPQSNVSRHLAVLRERSLVETRRDGTTIYYRLGNQMIGEACDMVRNVLQSKLERDHALVTSLGTGGH
jgi:DNA-binding transcriptional ArsR family regulator